MVALSQRIEGLADEETIELACWVTAESDRKSTRLNSSHGYISYAVFCLKKKKYRRYVMPKLGGRLMLRKYGGPDAGPTRRITRSSILVPRPVSANPLRHAGVAVRIHRAI